MTTRPTEGGSLRAYTYRRSGDLVPLLDEIDARGWVHAGNYCDRPRGRRELLEAVARLADGQADVLVVAEYETIGQLETFASLLARARREGWHVLALDPLIDTTTPPGRATADVLALFERPVTQGGRPRAIPDDVRDRIKREAAEGKSARAIARGLNEDGIPTAHGGASWHGSTVTYVLSTSEGSSSEA